MATAEFVVHQDDPTRPIAVDLFDHMRKWFVLKIEIAAPPSRDDVGIDGCRLSATLRVRTQRGVDQLLVGLQIDRPRLLRHAHHPVDAGDTDLRSIAADIELRHVCENPAIAGDYLDLSGLRRNDGLARDKLDPITLAARP